MAIRNWCHNAMFIQLGQLDPFTKTPHEQWAQKSWQEDPQYGGIQLPNKLWRSTLTMLLLSKYFWNKSYCLHHFWLLNVPLLEDKVMNGQRQRIYCEGWIWSKIVSYKFKTDHAIFCLIQAAGYLCLWGGSALHVVLDNKNLIYIICI